MTEEKTIAIFGAGSGLGASLANQFGREGYRVASLGGASRHDIQR